MFKGDFRDCARFVAPASMHAVITDPPYGSGGFTVREVMRSAKTKYVSSDASYQTSLPDIHNDNLHPEAWRSLMRQACYEAWRVLVEGGVLLMFIDWRQLGALMNCIHAAGFQVRGVAVWDKGGGSRPMRNGFRNQAEYVIWSSKGAIRRASDIYLPGLFKHSTITNGKVHITQKPIALMRDIINICELGGVVFDPFMGSGTTGVAVLESDRKFVGCESVDQYFHTAVERIKAANIAIST